MLRPTRGHFLSGSGHIALKISDRGFYPPVTLEKVCSGFTSGPLCFRRVMILFEGIYTRGKKLVYICSVSCIGLQRRPHRVGNFTSRNIFDGKSGNSQKNLLRDSNPKYIRSPRGTRRNLGEYAESARPCSTPSGNPFFPSVRGRIRQRRECFFLLHFRQNPAPYDQNHNSESGITDACGADPRRVRKERSLPRRRAVYRSQ